MTPGQNGPQFKYVFKAYIGAISAYLLRMMGAVDMKTAAVAMSDMTPAEQHDSNQLAYILAQTFTGSSLQLVMDAESYNGMEGW